MGFAGVVLPVPPLRNLNTFSAGEVIHPHFAGADGASIYEMLAGDDVLTVRRENGIVQKTKLLLAHLLAV